MPKIKHIALSTQDVDATAKFYVEVFGMKEIAKIDSPGARGYYLSDGNINLAILNSRTTRSPASSAARAGAASTTSAFRSRAWKRSPSD
jgi:catechol 2,3-dioxygenase-like lactoylglutathione lyase family enzyme